MRSLPLLSLAVMVLSACGSEYLVDEEFSQDDPEFRIDDSAKIMDSPQNREVLGVMLEYRQALVRKDVGTLNRIISKDYYENASTTDTTRDDYGRPELGDIFEMIVQHAENIQYRVTIKSVEIKKDRAFVDYEFRYAYQFKVGDDVNWDAGVDVNRVSMRLFEGEWKIVSGL